MKSATRKELSQAFSRAAAVLCGALLLGGALAGPVWAQAAPAEKSDQKAEAKPVPQYTASAILIERSEKPSVELGIPDDFRVAAYEYTVRQITRANIFKEVYRSGDRRAKDVPDLVTMRWTPVEFQKGSEAMRGATTVKGWTTLKVNVTITDPAGKTLVEKEITGKVRFMGENLNATYDLAKKAAGVVTDNFKPVAPPPAKK